jgi:hypothetical protein
MGLGSHGGTQTATETPSQSRGYPGRYRDTRADMGYPDSYGDTRAAMGLPGSHGATRAVT